MKHNYLLFTDYLKNHNLKKIIPKEVSIFYKLKVSLQLQFFLKIIHEFNLTIIFYNKYFFLLEPFISMGVYKNYLRIYKTSILFSFRLNLIYEFVKKNFENQILYFHSR